MLDAILHRGPDGWGAWQDPKGGASLLHCRLAIVDVEHGQQPMHDTHGHVTITFNGEIYGFERLRQELQADGYRFATRSDTEVLIAPSAFTDSSVLYVERRELTDTDGTPLEGRRMDTP